jgi:hypothetical protein
LVFDLPLIIISYSAFFLALRTIAAPKARDLSAHGGFTRHGSFFPPIADFTLLHDFTARFNKN